MKKTLSRIIVILFLAITAITLSGCKKKDEEVYLLRDIANKYQIVYAEDDSIDLVTDNIGLETQTSGVTITWSSSHPNIIVVPSGIVTTPEENTTVTLTAEFFYKGDKKDYVVTRKYELNVLSSESINQNNFGKARRKVIELSASKSEEDYLAATNLIEELLVPTGEDERYQTEYNKLLADYNNAKSIYILEKAVQTLRAVKTQEAYDEVVALLADESQTIKQSYQNTLNTELKHIQFRNLFGAAVNSALMDDYNAANDYFTANKNDFTIFTSTYEKDLENLKNYIDTNSRLQSSVYTPARLRRMIGFIPSFNFLSTEQLSTLETKLKQALSNDILDETKKTNHFNALVETLTAYKLEYNAENEVLIKHLLEVYNLEDANELKATFAVTQLLHKPLHTTFDDAVAANDVNSNPALKAEYEVILTEYSNFFDIERLIMEIRDLVIDNVITHEIIDQVYDDVLILEGLLSDYYDIDPNEPNIIDAFIAKNIETVVDSSLISQAKTYLAPISTLFVVEESINEMEDYITETTITNELARINQELDSNYQVEYEKVLNDIKKVTINFNPEPRPVDENDEVIVSSNENVLADISLPKLGESGTVINWKSSYEEILNGNGVLKRIDQKNQRSRVEPFSIVELTATVSSSKYPQRFSASVIIPVIVFAKDAETYETGREVDLSLRYDIPKYSTKEVNKFAKDDVHSEYGRFLVQKIQKARQNVNSLSSLQTTKLLDYYKAKYEQTAYDSAEVYLGMIEDNLNELSKATFSSILAENTEQSMRVYLQRYEKELLDIEYNKPRSAKLVGKYLAIFLAILLFLLSQGLTAAYADKKGYEGVVNKLIATIPIGGMIYFKYVKPRRNTSKHGLRQVFAPKEIFMKILIYLEIVLIALIVVVPVVYIFGMALSGLRTDIPNTLWPEKPNFRGLTELFHQTDFTRWYGNTLKIAVVNMVVGTVLITGASYVFSRFSFKGKKAGLLTLLALQSFPTFMSLLATYVLFWKFGLLGRPLALSLIYIGGSIPGNLWLVKGFLDQVPKDLDESANIDGANKLQIFFNIILPLAVPILTFVAVSMFMSPWMDYMLPGYLLNVPPVGEATDYNVQQNWTLAVGLFDFINNPDNINYSAFAFGALFVGLPITIIYMVFQKYLIEGIMAGATKG